MGRSGVLIIAGGGAGWGINEKVLNQIAGRGGVLIIAGRGGVLIHSGAGWSPNNSGAGRGGVLIIAGRGGVES